MADLTRGGVMHVAPNMGSDHRAALKSAGRTDRGHHHRADRGQSIQACAVRTCLNHSGPNR